MRRGTLALTAVTALLTLAAPAPATFPGRDGLIAFDSEYELEGCLLSICETDTNVMRMTPRGRRLKRLAASGAQPAWSPGGRWIAFVRSERIWVMRADGSRARSLRVPGSSPAWAPDGRRIAFRAAGWEHRTGIAVVRFEGRSGRFLTRGTHDHAPAWSPNGRRIAFTRARAFDDETYDLMSIDPGGRRLRRLVVDCDCDEPDYSPDGRRLVYSGLGVSRRPRFGIFVANADGSARRPVTHDFDYSPVWSPSGRRIAFERDSEIFAMNADGSNARRLGYARRQAPPDDVYGEWGHPAWQALPRSR